MEIKRANNAFKLSIVIFSRVPNNNLFLSLNGIRLIYCVQNLVNMAENNSEICNPDISYNLRSILLYH